MARNLSPVVRQELANLEKDADSRKLAMKALKSYVKDLDSKAIPLFLAQVSETKETGSVSGEYTISLYEVLARVHGANIVPQINSIMATIIKTLASSAGSFPLQQACSKVVPAIARYGIDPTTPEDKKRHIIHSLCKPLSDSLMGSQESLTSGAALCLEALVDSDNWRFASDEMVNKVCQNVAVALKEKSTQTNSHMGLVMGLAKHNSLIVEAYARLLLQSGLQILNAGVLEGNSQKRLSAIQMVNFLMKSLDPRSIFSELELIIDEMEKCQSDQMAYVGGAAFEALQTARRIMAEKELKFERGSGSITGSNFSRRDHGRRRNFWKSGDQTPATMSPESQTLGSFLEYDSMIESPMSMTQVSYNNEYDRRSVNRKLWNGRLDVSLEDGLFSEWTHGSPIGNKLFENSGNYELTDNGRHYTDEFAGFQRNPRNRVARSSTPSPQRSFSPVNDGNIFTTPRKLIHSLQEPNDVNSDFSEKQTRRFRSPASRNFERSPSPSQNGFSCEVAYEVEGNGNLYDGDEQFQGVSESVSSTDDTPADADVQMSREVVPASRTTTQKFCIEKTRKTTASKLVLCLLFTVLAVVTSFLWIGGQDEVYHLVPT
ncbi:hypothetical protein CFOL_v3_35906 [Cephalotus follicularis]|uniref:TORTIFOLIA1/SINE1-2 N-terminal domain-containing protein n=1 Tax=Cephalotus follicularis TaxID=3775 RepID=A0A1Q3DJ47_CEPFO|nr:hypothetical protein CFOL_v3_16177 [Cephalotus follicularis]GAV92527.1 hypothetical protein CFOL_v3_35906 [Cephalotus follicularis]